MNAKFVLLVAVFGAAAADKAYNAPPPPPPATQYYTPQYHSNEQYPAAPAVYSYQYAVQDDYSGVNFGHSEDRNGAATKGQYRVLLPDGRTQIVTYTVADAYSGYVADVTYEGVAKYPEQQNTYKPQYKAPNTYNSF